MRQTVNLANIYSPPRNGEIEGNVDFQGIADTPVRHTEPVLRGPEDMEQPLAGNDELDL